jgi:hypothetical protein
MDHLDRFIADERGIPFVWGNDDCCLFIGRWVAFATGRRFLDDWTGTYDDEPGARHRIDAAGGAPTMFTGYLGTPITPALAVRGDIGVKSYDGWHMAMICTGQMWAAKRLKGGVSMLRMVPDMAWRVRG